MEKGAPNFTRAIQAWRSWEKTCNYLSCMGLPYHTRNHRYRGRLKTSICASALVNPGDEVIIPEPCFVCYYPITTLTGGVPVPLPLKLKTALS